jgi:hypothetical protein
MASADLKITLDVSQVIRAFDLISDAYKAQAKILDAISKKLKNDCMGKKHD